MLYIMRYNYGIITIDICGHGNIKIYLRHPNFTVRSYSIKPMQILFSRISRRSMGTGLALLANFQSDSPFPDR